MKTWYAFVYLMLVSTISSSQENGRTHLDHMSIVVPSEWEANVLSDGITLTAPSSEPTLYQRCSVTIGTAGSFGGTPLDLISVVDSNVPANLAKEPIRPVQVLTNGWSATERIYRNRYVPGLFIRVIAVTKGGIGQVFKLSNDLSTCSRVTEPIAATLRINDQPKRLLASGALLKLPLPIQRDQRTDGQKAGTVCRAGGITCLNGGPVGSSCMCASTAGPQIGTVF